MRLCDPEFPDKAAGFFKKPACKPRGLELKKSDDTPILVRPDKGPIVAFRVHLAKQPVPIPHGDPKLREVGLKCALEQGIGEIRDQHVGKNRLMI